MRHNPIEGLGDHAQPAWKDISSEQIQVRHLTTTDEIRQMARLRRQIDLAAVASADPRFDEHEKKKTSWAASWPSTCTVRSSGPSA